MLNALNIEAFVKIVELGSISKAADVLFVSQSTLSDRLKALEKEVNVTLIHRSAGVKGVKLTSKGTEFLNFANRYMRLEKDVEGWKDNILRQKISISAPNSINCFFLNDFYFTYVNSSEYKLNISSHWNHTIYNMVETFELDMGIVSRPYNSQNIRTQKIFQEPLLIVYDSEYSHYDDLHNVEELKRSNEIHLDWGPDYELWYQNYWNLDEFPKITVDSPDILMQFLRTPKAWTILPLCVFNHFQRQNPNLKNISHKDPIYRTIYLVRQREISDFRKEKLERFLQDLDGYLCQMEEKNLCKKLLPCL